MATVVECSPANSTSVLLLVIHINHQVINRLSPSNYLIRGQRGKLNVLRCFSWLHLLGPNTFSFTLLVITMLHESVIWWGIESLLPQLATSSFEFSIHHDLIVYVILVNSVLCFVHFFSVFALVDIDIWVLLSDGFIIGKDPLCSILFLLSWFSGYFLFPETELLISF